MSDLLPNLDALLEKLGGDSPAVCDARALAEAVVTVGTEDDIDAALDAVISHWRRV